MTAHLDGPTPTPPTPPATLLQRIRYLEQETGFNTDAVHDLTYAVETLARAENEARGEWERVFAQLADWAAAVAARLSGNAPTEPAANPTAGLRGESAGRARPLPIQTLRVWVNDHLVPYVRAADAHRAGAMHWCPRWTEHHDAVERFTALYHAHRELAATGDPLWLSVYLRDHLDHHLRLLTGPEGSFAACASGVHASFPPETVQEQR